MSKFYRAASFFRKHSSEEEKRLLACIAPAKLPANVGADDIHLMQRQIKHLAYVHA